MNYLVMSERNWNKLEYTYFQLIKHLHLIILTRETDFIIYKNQFDIDRGKTYPISQLNDYIRDHEAINDLDKMEI